MRARRAGSSLAPLMRALQSAKADFVPRIHPPCAAVGAPARSAAEGHAQPRRCSFPPHDTRTGGHCCADGNSAYASCYGSAAHAHMNLTSTERRGGAMKIAVLMGGTSAEREVSLASGLGIVKALREKGHEVWAVDTARGFVPHDREAQLL